MARVPHLVDLPVSARAAWSALRPPPGAAALPPYDGGWHAGGGVDAYLSYVADHDEVNWSAELEKLHAESSRDHFIDVWTRRAILDRVGPLPAGAAIVDLGCSTGYLLEDLRKAHGDTLLIGVDLIGSGLRTAHRSVPDARLVQADVCALPIEDASIDVVVSANLLEHVPDDEGALAELYRVLRPGAHAVIVVPTGPGSYDYYDRFLKHERRYGRGELVAKAARAGLVVQEDAYLGSVLFPSFWLIKRRNQWRYGHLQGDALESLVMADIAATRDSFVGRLSCAIERRLLDRGIRLPFGIRGITVLRRPECDGR